MGTPGVMAAALAMQAASSIAQAREARKTRKATIGEIQANEQRAQSIFEQQMADFQKEDTMKAKESKKSPTSRAARARQKARGAFSREDTILTGPQGILEDEPVNKKSILGA